MSCVKYRVRDQHMLALLLLQLIVSNCTNEGHEKHESVMGFFKSRILFFFHILKDAPTLSRYPVTDAVSLTHAFHGPFWCSFRMNCTENRANSAFETELLVSPKPIPSSKKYCSLRAHFHNGTPSVQLLKSKMLESS